MDKALKVKDYSQLRDTVVLTLQARVIKIMADNKLSKRGVAKKGNVPYTVIHELVEFGTDPRLSTVHRLAKGLGVSFKDLVL